mmetsp:Transcript_8980/g.16168  ORF Transcript_8980/g.16168 Transcript_8980/m.16168 type:complete len:363 (+) Transcript_8980:102-1190(+)
MGTAGGRRATEGKGEGGGGCGGVSDVKVGLLALRAHLLQLLQDAAVVLGEVGLQRGGLRRVHPQQLVRLLHRRADHRVVAQQLRKRQSVGSVLGPLEGAQEAAAALQQPHRDGGDLGSGVRQVLTHRDNLVDGVGLGTGQRERLPDGLLAAQRRERHLGRVHRVKVRRLGLVPRPPHALLLQHRNGVVTDHGLHEPAHAQDGVVEPALLQIILRAALDVHERHLGVLVAVVDGAKDEALDPHRLRRLNERLLPLPIDFLGALLGPRGGTVDDRVHTHQRCGNGGLIRQVSLNNGDAPITKEVGGVGARTHNAAHVVAVVQRLTDHLPAQGAGAAHHQHARLGDWGARLGSGLHLGSRTQLSA